MPRRLRRAPLLFARLKDTRTVEVQALLEGRVELRHDVEAEVFGPFAGRPRVCTARELDLISAVAEGEATASAEVLRRCDAEESELRPLLEAEILLDADDPRIRALATVPWHPVAHLFHVASLFEGRAADPTRSLESIDSGSMDDALDLDLDFDLDEKLRTSEEAVERHIEAHGPPPALRLRFDGDAEPRTLPASDRSDSFFDALAARRTTRHFADAPVARDDFADLLRWTFGVRATVSLGRRHRVALKSSPSGGSLHPVEAYPIVFSVDGVEPGLYHYDAFAHALEPLRLGPAPQLRELVVQLASGQTFTGRGAFVVLLVARLGRNYWKYPHSCRTYAVMHQDAGHLSQTFYLVATRLGLGAFYTAALDGRTAERRLGLETSVEAPLGLCGCGPILESARDWLGAEAWSPDTAQASAEEVRPVVGSGAGSATQLGEPLPGEAGLGPLRISPTFEED